MKLKTSAIALAVAGIIAAPMAAQADIGGYGSIRHGLVNVDNGDGADSSINFAQRGSRLGFKGDTDLGNGMTVFGKYEFAITSQKNAGADGTVSLRHGILGMEGDFGKVVMGNQWHTYYDNVNSAVDIANWNSGYYSVGRTGEAVSYSNSFGAANVGVTAYFRDDATSDTGLDGTELSVSFDAGPVKIGLGTKSDDMADGTSPSVTGVSVSGTFSEIYVGMSMQNFDDDAGGEFDSLEISGSMGQGYIIYAQGEADVSGAPTATDLTLGYTIPLGRNTSSWVEYVTSDADDGSDDDTSLEYIVKYSW
jgi:predicted porin